MKTFDKERWGFFPSAICIPLLIIIIMLRIFTEYRLRNVPRMIFIGMCLTSLGILMLWVCVLLFKRGRTKSGIWFKIAAVIQALVSVAVLTTVGYLTFFVYMFFFYRSEEVVVKHDIKMVAEERTHYFVDDFYFYEYKNPLFYGKRLGYEDHYDGADKAFSWYFYDLDGNLIDASEDYLETLESGDADYNDWR